MAQQQKQNHRRKVSTTSDTTTKSKCIPASNDINKKTIDLIPVTLACSGKIRRKMFRFVVPSVPNLAVLFVCLSTITFISSVESFSGRGGIITTTTIPTAAKTTTSTTTTPNTLRRLHQNNVIPGQVGSLPDFATSTSTTTTTLLSSSGSSTSLKAVADTASSNLSIDGVVDTAVDAAVAATASDSATILAQALGYLVGAGSLLLYTPIAIRLLRQRSADGLTLSTWWLKLASYSCSDIYAFTNGYPISTYVETLIITAEAFIILILVAHYQKQLDRTFGLYMTSFVLFVSAGMTVAPPELISIGQGSAALLNVGALIPQFQLNAKYQTSGDYSPVTAALAATGCFIRVFTTIQLANSDPLLLGTFGLALVLNASLLLQILYYGVIVEKRGLWTVLTADLGGRATTRRRNEDDDSNNDNNNNNDNENDSRSGRNSSSMSVSLLQE